MNRCRQCDAPLSADEISLHKKLINRGATDFMCIGCLAEFFGCTTERLNEKIEQFRRDGCSLFSPQDAVQGTACGEAVSPMTPQHIDA